MSHEGARTRLVLGLLAAVAWTLGLSAFDHAAVMHLVPLLAVLAPLLLRRYPGERLLVRHVQRPTTPPRSTPTLRPTKRVRARRQRGIAWSLAQRPPPALRMH